MSRLKVIIPLLIIAMLTGCGSKSSSDKSAMDSGTSSAPQFEESKNDTAYDQSGESPGEGAMDSEGEKPSMENIQGDKASSKKIIDRANLRIETVEFDKSLENLDKTLEQFKGYMESSNVNQPGVGSGKYKTYRNGNFIVRIPKANFQDFINLADNLGVVTNEGTSTEDITKEYYDTETRLKVYQAQEARYLELLKESKTMEDILTIESHLTEVRYNIEYLTGYKNQMNDLVDYGTVNIEIYEVDEPSELIESPKTLGDKIINAFKTSMGSLKYVGTTLILIFVSVLPYILIIGGSGAVVLYFIKKRGKKK